MEPKQTVLLLTHEATIATAVSAALAKHDAFAANGTYGDLGSLASRLAQSPAPAVLVDIDPDAHRMLSELETLVTRFPQTRFVVLSHDTSSQLILKAMTVGVRQYLPKTSVAAELAGVLERLVPRQEVPRAQGSLIPIFGASGGCGATTMAVNLADQLQRLTQGPALISDLDLVLGGVGSYLGLSGPFSLADVATKSGRIDPELVRSTALAYSDRLHVLLSPASSHFFDPPRVQMDNLPAVFEACRGACPVTIVDAPRAPIDVAAALAGPSLATLIVFQLNVKDVRTAQNLMLALGERGVNPSQLIPVVNRYQKRNTMVNLEDAQRALPGVKLWLVRNDYPAASRALNYGQPLSQSAPRSALFADLRDLAEHLLERHKSNQAGKGG